MDNAVEHDFEYDFDEILRDVSFGEWEFMVRADGERPYLQIRAYEPCNETGKLRRWQSRKWFLSPYMTKSEVVSTAFKAVMTAVEHETREKFTYYGAAIYAPHHNVDHLVGLCRDHRPDARQARA